jgi:hypothetical protein
MKYMLIAILIGFTSINSVIAEVQQNQKAEEKINKEKIDKKKARKKRKSMNKLPAQWHILNSISSAERNRLRQLYATNPKAFKQELAKIVKRIKQQKQKLNEKTRLLVQQYKNTKDAKKKKEILNQLRQITRKIFYSKMQHNKKRLEVLEKQVKILRQQYEFRQKNADKIIQARLDTLTESTNFDW